MIVFVDNLTEGMVLQEDLLTRQGRLIIGKGVTLKAQHLKVLKSWGVSEAHIVDDSFQEKEGGVGSAGDEFLAQARDFVTKRFAGQDLEHPFLAELVRLASLRYAQWLASGKQFKAAPVPEEADVPNTTSKQHPKLLVRGIADLVTLPSVYFHITEVINSPHASSSAVAKIVSKDTNLSLKLLRLVNSAFYGFPGQVDSISRAITLLGTNELTTLALGISVLQTFNKVPQDLIDMEAFWKHSIRCGLFAQVLCSYKVGISEETMFVGGLLHDVGRLVMLRQIPEQYSQVMRFARQQRISMEQAENKLLECTHSDVGGALGSAWNIAPSMIRMIGDHHHPERERYQTEASLLHVANILAHAFCEDPPIAESCPAVDIKAWDSQGISPGVLSAAVIQVDRMFRDVVNIFL